MSAPSGGPCHCTTKTSGCVGLVNGRIAAAAAAPPLPPPPDAAVAPVPVPRNTPVAPPPRASVMLSRPAAPATGASPAGLPPSGLSASAAPTAVADVSGSAMLVPRTPWSTRESSRGREGTPALAKVRVGWGGAAVHLRSSAHRQPPAAASVKRTVHPRNSKRRTVRRRRAVRCKP